MRAVRDRGYTLVEMLIVIVILGISAALVVPVISAGDPLRVQTAVRAVASDIMFAQSDALAYQQRRAIVFDVDRNLYTLTEVTGGMIDPAADALFRVDGVGQRYEVDLDKLSNSGATIDSVDFDGDNMLIFDEIGGPVLSPTSDEPSVGGYVDLIGPGSVFRISVEPYTGRVTVERQAVGP